MFFVWRSQALAFFKEQGCVVLDRLKIDRSDLFSHIPSSPYHTAPHSCASSPCPKAVVGALEAESLVGALETEALSGALEAEALEKTAPSNEPRQCAGLFGHLRYQPFS